MTGPSDRWGDDDYMPMGPGFYLPCRRFFDADYLALAHRMDGCTICDEAEQASSHALPTDGGPE